MLVIVQIEQLAEIINVIFGHISLLLHRDQQHGKRAEDHLVALLPLYLLLELSVQALSLVLPIQNLAAHGVKEGHRLIAKPSRLLHAR